jgi:hypothetical protein
MSSDNFGDVLLTTKEHGKNQISVRSENTSQTVFIRNDKLSEIVYHSVSDGGKFSKLSDETCKVRLVPVTTWSKA